VVTHPFLPHTRLGVVVQLDADRSHLLMDPDPEEMFEPNANS
jgi:hypothetical protein